MFEILFVFDAMFFEASFPYVEGALQFEGEAAFDELHCFFDGDILCGSHKQVDMVGHDDVGVKLEAALLAVVLKNAEK